MSWNYRIFKEIESIGSIDNPEKEDEIEVFTIREVHYEEETHKPVRYTEPYWPVGETERNLLYNIEQMLLAFQKPVLTVQDFE